MESPILLNFVLWHMINLINTLPIHPFIHLESYSPMTSLPLFVIKKEKLNYSIFWFLSIFDKFLIFIHKTILWRKNIWLSWLLPWVECACRCSCHWGMRSCLISAFIEMISLVLCDEISIQSCSWHIQKPQRKLKLWKSRRFSQL